MPRDLNVVTQDELHKRMRSIYASFCRGAPSLRLVADPNLSDELQNWIGMNLKSRYRYATCISIMDAARTIAESQIDNGGECLGGDR